MHIDERLPTNVELGAIRRDTMNLDIARQDSGHEDINRLWNQFLGEYDITYPIAKRDGPTNASFAVVYAAFRATGGGEHSFDFKDWRDHSANEELFGVGDGVTVAFPLVKNYGFGPVSHQRRIYRPVSPIEVRKNGVVITTGFTVDYELGIVTFVVAPVGGGTPDELDWSGEFNVPVRFDKTLQSVAQTIQNERYDTFTLFEKRLKASDFS